MALKLTDKEVRTLAAPASGNRIIYDTEVKGFGARITSAGARSFVLNYRIEGRERRFTIGSFPDWTVSAARDQAKQLKRRVDLGEDPMAERASARTAPTVQDLADRYSGEHAPRKRPRSAEEDAALLRQHILPRLGRLRVEAVRRADIETLHRDISRATPIRANRALALLSKMFSLAIGWEMRPDNPCRGIEKNAENKRERYLTPAELERLMSTLAGHTCESSANAIRILLLTGARRGEVLGAKWDQFDLTAGVWTKPASATKQGKAHRVPLSAPARDLLAEMHARADGPALFPGRRGAEQQYSLKTFWAAVCKAAQISGVRVHDLRHSYASYLASAGLSLPVIGALLGHASPNTTHRYAHLLDDPLRAATDRVGAMVTRAGKGAGVVVPIRRARASP
jgi:integrase